MWEDVTCSYDLCSYPVDQIISLMAEIPSYATHSAKWNLVTSAPVDFEKLFLSSAIYMQDE